MGRYQAKKRQESKKKPERKAVEYTTSAGRGKNRVAAKAKPSFKGPGGNPNGSGEGEAQKRPLKTIPASKRPKDMQAGVRYGEPEKPTTKKTTPKEGDTKTLASGRKVIFKKSEFYPEGRYVDAPRTSPPRTTPTPKVTTPKVTPSTKVSSPKKTAPKPAEKKPAATTPKKPRTWLKDNYKSGGPAKEALKVKPKKKRLTNKQRKQGGFH